MSSVPRWTVWLILLVIAGGVVWFDRTSGSPPAVVQAVERKPANERSQTPGKQANTEASSTAPMILAIRERGPVHQVADSFAPHDWTPPPPRPKPVAPAIPTAPPLQFTVLGKQLAGGVWQVFLARQDRVYVVKAGDTVDNTYRVDEIKPPLLTLTYVPLNERQTLPIGGIE